MSPSVACRTAPYRHRFALNVFAAALATVVASGPASAIITADGGLAGLPAGLSLAGVGLLSNRCSSVLLAGGGHVLTSAHCSAAPGSSVTFNGGAVTATVAGQATSSDYDGTALGGLAVLTLTSRVTSVKGYALTSVLALPSDIVLAGYGYSGSGAGGAADVFGSLRYGYNQYEVLAAANPGSLPANVSSSNVAGYDFDDGSAASNRFGSLGHGNEAMISSWDSGGPSFAFQGGEWRVAGIHTGIDGQYGSGYGSVGYDLLVSSYSGWVGTVTGVSPVPEPASAALLLAGLGGVFGASRRVARGSRRTPA